ncbi:sialin-like [Babylonia areolata]|uniref:sialin-like n=1 Tax=Babylonia areolata TaxID=304850 RepID=UPI003FCF7299
MDPEGESTRLTSTPAVGDQQYTRPAGGSTEAAAFSHQTNDTTLHGERRFKLWPIPKRYVIAVLAFLGFANIYALRVNLSVAIVSMTSNRTRVVNGTVETIPPEYPWSTHLQGQVLASFFYGYILSQLPGGFLSNRFGGKYFFGGGILLTALLTLLTPVFTTWSIYLLISARVCEGLFEGVTYPSIHAIWAKWAPPQEKTRLATFAFAGSYFGTVISLPASGALASSSSGWPSIFYVFGFVAVVWFLLWCVFVTESPSGHPGITNAELEYIQQSIGYTEEQSKRVHPPWLRMLSSPPVWAIVVAHFAENWGFYTFLTELPTFMKHVLRFDMTESGLYSALPYAFMCIIVMTSGMMADGLMGVFGVPTGTVRKLFTCGAFGVQAIFMVAAGYVMTKAAAVTCLTVAVGVGGLAWAGFSVNHLDVAPQFASILMGLSNTFATLPGIVSPLLTGAVVTDQTSTGEWQIIFYLAAAVYLLGALTFGLLASGDRQDWAHIPMGYQAYLDDPEKDD